MPANAVATVLLLTPTGRDADLACAMLGRADIRSWPCASTDELIGRIAEGAGPIVVAPEALDLQSLGQLEAALDAQPSWSDLPVVVLVGQAGLPRPMRELAVRFNSTLLHRPTTVPTFVTTVRAAVQNRLRQYQVRDLLRRLEDRAQQLQRMAFELDEAEERERQRLARILHDDLQQILAGANFHLSLLPRRVKAQEMDQAVAELSEVLRLAIDRSRLLAHELSPPMLRQHGLVAALQWLAGHMERLHGLKVKHDLDEQAEPDAMSLRMFAFRSTQELLFNVSKHAQVDEAHVRLRRAGPGIELTVRDRGRGMDPAQVEQIGSEGMGYGLLSIHDRASLLGGSLQIRSEPGKGAEFCLTLPIQAPQVAGHGRGGGMEPDPAGATSDNLCQADDRRFTVLIVDDHQIACSGLRAFLEAQADIKVIAEAGNGSEAVKLAEQLEPAVVLIDVSMPQMDGIEATRRIKTRQPQIRIIGLSMFDDRQTTAQMLAAGAESHLSKSGASDKVLAAIRQGRGHLREGL